MHSHAMVEMGNITGFVCMCECMKPSKNVDDKINNFRNSFVNVKMRKSLSLVGIFIICSIFIIIIIGLTLLSFVFSLQIKTTTRSEDEEESL